MVIKVDKSEEFKKSGKKLISEYDAQEWLDKIEKNDERELFEMKRKKEFLDECTKFRNCLLYTSPSPRDRIRSRMPSSA